jgi:hypothetical protein
MAVQFRLVDGTRVLRNFRSTDTLQNALDFVLVSIAAAAASLPAGAAPASVAAPLPVYRLLLTYPRRALEPATSTFAQLNVPTGSVLVAEKVL